MTQESTPKGVLLRGWGCIGPQPARWFCVDQGGDRPSPCYRLRNTCNLDRLAGLEHGHGLMGLQLKNIVPWGRSLDEYVRMFALSPEDLQRQILDCAGGPASFNAEMQERGERVVSCDPIYQFSAAQIQQRVTETWPVILEGVKANAETYVWSSIPDPDSLGQLRLAAMQWFIQDFPVGLPEGRYVFAELPRLPFASGQFDLALCGHLLFAYSLHLSLEFHQLAVAELCRVAQEVRIFPVLMLDGGRSPWLDPVIEAARQAGHTPDLITVPYEFQKGGNQMLRIQVKQHGKS